MINEQRLRLAITNNEVSFFSDENMPEIMKVIYQEMQLNDGELSVIKDGFEDLLKHTTLNYIHYTVLMNRFEILKKLNEYGANLFVGTRTAHLETRGIDFVMDSISLSILIGNNEMLEYLLEAKSKKWISNATDLVLRKISNYKNRFRMFLVRQGLLAAKEFLMSDQMDFYMGMALDNEDMLALGTLLKHGANANAKITFFDKYSTQTLSYFGRIVSKNLDLACKLFLENGAKIEMPILEAPSSSNDYKPSQYLLPLEVALIEKSTKCARLLIDEHIKQNIAIPSQVLHYPLVKDCLEACDDAKILKSCFGFLPIEILYNILFQGHGEFAMDFKIFEDLETEENPTRVIKVEEIEDTSSSILSFSEQAKDSNKRKRDSDDEQNHPKKQKMEKF